MEAWLVVLYFAAWTSVAIAGIKAVQFVAGRL